MRTAGELLSRGNNLLACGFVAVVGLAALPELSTEGTVGALDEGGMVLLAAGAIAWYWRSRYRNTWLTVVLPAVLILLKVFALTIEDVDDRGDDIGLLITAFILTVAWTVIKVRSDDRAGVPAAAAASRS